MSKQLARNAKRVPELAKRKLSEKAFRESAEQKVHKNERFFRRVVYAIQDGISVLDNDLNIVFVNPTMQKCFPESEPLKGKKCYQVFHGRRKPCKDCPAIRALDSGNLETSIVPRVVSQKIVGWFEIFSFPMRDSNGNQNGVVETVRDVTERINTEHLLCESEQRFRIFADFTHDWEYWVASDGNYIFVSPSCERITGYPADDFLRNPGLLEKIIHPDDRALAAEHFKNDLKSKDTKLIEFRILTRDGEVRWINHICHPVFDDKRQYQGRRASNKDITKRKLSEEALHKAQEDLENRVRERTSQLKNAAKELQSRQKELLDHKSKLEKANKELLETNRAISVLARNIDKNRQETESNLAKAINSKLMPLVENLRKAKNLESSEADLDILAANVQSLTNDLTGGVNLMASLTPAEMRIATMIKKGLTSQEIADKLYVSLHTAKTHRRNIRKKFKISNSRINLTSYLQSIMW